MRNLIEKINTTIIEKIVKVKMILANNKGEGYVDTGVKILIGVVLGALLLGGLYLLFNDTILPELTKRVKEMFNYKG